MDVNLRKCNSCDKLNENSETGWVRVSGIEASDGKRAMPVHNIKLDFCPACASATTVDKVPEIISTVWKANMPEHMRRQLEATARPNPGIPSGPVIKDSVAV